MYVEADHAEPSSLKERRKKQVNNKLRELRKAKGMAMLEWFAKSGVALNTIIAIEKYGYNPTANMKSRLAEALGLSVADIWPQ